MLDFVRKIVDLRGMCGEWLNTVRECGENFNNISIILKKRIAHITLLW